MNLYSIHIEKTREAIKKIKSQTHSSVAARPAAGQDCSFVVLLAHRQTALPYMQTMNTHVTSDTIQQGSRQKEAQETKRHKGQSFAGYMLQWYNQGKQFVCQLILSSDRLSEDQHFANFGTASYNILVIQRTYQVRSHFGMRSIIQNVQNVIEKLLKE